MAERKYIVRFAADDMDKVRTAMKGMGSDGASAFRAIEAGSRQATPALKAVDNAVGEVRREFDSWADRIPIVGGALKSLGPIGIGVGAALAGIGMGVNALSNATRKAIADVSALKDAADTLQLSAEQLQGLRAAASLEGIAPDAIDKAMQTFALNAARASEGFGKMKAALAIVNPELGRQLALTSTQGERFAILARGIQEATTQNEKLNLAAAAFGQDGGQMVRLLDKAGASLETFTDQAKAAGLVISDKLVGEVEELGDRLDRLADKQNVAMQRAAVSAAPLVEAVSEVQTSLLLLLPNIQDAFKALEDQSEEYIRSVIEGSQRAIRTNNPFIDQARELEKIARLEAEIQRRRALGSKTSEDAAALAARERLYDSVGDTDAEQSAGRAAARKKAAADAVAAEKAAAEATKLRADQEKQAIEIRASLGDWTGKLAQREAELDALVKAGTLSREAANEAAEKYRGELDGSTATINKWKAAVQSAQTPVEKAQQALADFAEEALTVTDRGPAFQAMLRYLADGLKEAERAADEATPAFKAVAEARARIAEDADSHLTVQDKMASEWARLTTLIGENGFTLEEARAALIAYREDLDRTTGSAKDAGYEMRFAAEAMDEILNGNIESWSDLGRVATRVLSDMVRDWLRANQSMAGKQGIGDWFAQAFSAIFGGGGGGTPGEFSVGTATPAGVHHSGIAAIGMTPSATRMMPLSAFANAPRFHSGLAPDEFPSVLQRGERVLSRVHNERLVQAVEGGGAAKVEVNFYGDFGGKPEVTQSQNADGSTRIDIKKMVRDGAADFLGSQAGAKLMQDRFGIRRAVRG